MSSNIKLKNVENTEFSIQHNDGEGAVSITSTQLKNANYTVATVEDMEALTATDGQVCIVSDLDRGGLFIYDSTEVSNNNDGTNFNGWMRQYSGAVNVKWFGAKGDGVTDDTVAIQSALNANLVNYYFPDGEYLVSLAERNNTSRLTSSILYTENDVNIIGSGTIKVNESSSALIMFHIYNTDKASIKGLCFNGQYSDFSTSTYNTTQFGLAIERVSKSYVSECNFYNISNIGLSITASLTTADDTFISENSIVEKCYFEKVYQNSTSYNGVKNIKVTDCDFVDVIGIGFKFGGRHYTLDNVVFSNNRMRFTTSFETYTDISTTSMIDVHSAYKSVLIDGNFLDFENCTNTTFGIATTLDNEVEFNASEKVIISNNQVKTTSGTGSSSIYVHNGVKYVGIYDNILDGTPSNAISYSDYEDYNLNNNTLVVQGNMIYGAVNAGIYISNTSSIKNLNISNNVITDSDTIYGIYIQVDEFIDASFTISDNTININTFGIRCNGLLSHVSIFDNIIRTQDVANSTGIYAQATDEYGRLYLKDNVIRTANYGYRAFNFENVSIGGNSFYDCNIAEYLSATDNSSFELNSYENVTTIRSFNSITNNFGIFKGTSSPNGVLEASYGSQFLSSNGTGTTDLYIKESASGTSGWVNK